MGASRIIGVEVDPTRIEQAGQLGCDEVLVPQKMEKDWLSDPKLVDRVLQLTDGIGVDVAMEMVGLTLALNNAIKSSRRGGHVVLFGVRNGDARIEDCHRVIMNGLQLHGVVGRRIFSTWETTRNLLEKFLQWDSRKDLESDPQWGTRYGCGH